MNLAQNYARILRDGVDAAKTLAYMKARGHLSLLPQVVRMLEREQGRNDSVKVAREADAPVAKKRFPGAKVVVDPKIVGGYFLKKGTTLTDATYRQALVTIYKNAVNQHG